jgi:hypothetical protein
MFFRAKISETGGLPALKDGLRRSQQVLGSITGTMMAFGLPPEDHTAPSFPMIRSPQEAVDAIGKIARAILKVLERDPKLRELHGDFVHKLAYLVALGGALIKLGEDVARLDSSDPNRYLRGLSACLRAFVEYEACFQEHKNLETWNRLKGEAAAKLDAKHYTWLNTFYMNFSIFAGLATRIAGEIANLLDEIARLLARGDKPALLEALRAGLRAAQAVQRLAQALGELFEVLGETVSDD